MCNREPLCIDSRYLSMCVKEGEGKSTESENFMLIWSNEDFHRIKLWEYNLIIIFLEWCSDCFLVQFFNTLIYFRFSNCYYFKNFHVFWLREILCDFIKFQVLLHLNYEVAHLLRNALCEGGQEFVTVHLFQDRFFC